MTRPKTRVKVVEKTTSTERMFMLDRQWDAITTKIGPREVNLAEEIERLSDQISDLCIKKRRQQLGEPVQIDDWVLRLRCPEDVIDRMFKMNKIKTTMEADNDVIEGFLSRVRVLAMKKYLERCRR